MKGNSARLTKRMSGIVKIGAKLFSRKGFAETTMDDIASQARLSKGGIYHYFSSKTELLYYILDNFMDIVLKDLQEELDAMDNGLEKVKRLVFRHVAIFPKYMAEAKTLFHEAKNLPPKSFKKVIAKESEYIRITAEVLSDYFGPSVKRSEITAMTFILLGMCNSIYSWYNPKSRVSPEHLSQMVFDILIDGFCGIQKKNSGSS